MALRMLLVVAVIVNSCLFAVEAGGFLTGGSDGADLSQFLTGTSGKAKVVLGLTCSKPNATTDILSVGITAFENDDQFNSTGGVNNNDVITWAKCQMLNVSAYRGNNMKQRLHGEGCNLTRVDNNGDITAGDVDERTLTTTLDFDVNGAVPCGGIQTGTVYTFLMECYRTEQFTKHFDFIAEFTCDNSTATIRQLETNTTIGNPAQYNVTRRNFLTTKIWHVKDANAVTPSPKLAFEEVTNEIVEVTDSTTLNLGDAIVVEVCLYINTTADTRPYFLEGHDVMGVSLKNMYMSNIESHNPVQANYVSTKQVVTNRCGNGIDPASELTGVSFFYKQPTTTGTKWELISPNCFRTKKFSVVSFVAKNKGTTKMNMTLEFDYCTSSELSSDKNKCFGNKTSTDDLLDDYEPCLGPGRKRREADDESDDAIARAFEERGFPREVTFELTVNTGDEEESDIQTSEGERVTEPVKCFEKETFTILTAVLAFLLVLVLLVSLFLAFRIQSVRRHVKEGSQSGFSNNGYY